MSLLLRRRSGQALEHLSEESLVSHRTGSTLPDNYDPSIRGNVVHDFSAPRPPRNYSGTTLYTLGHLEPEGQESSSREGRASAQDHYRPEKRHTPIFQENFDDEDQIRNDAGIRAEELANKAFIARNSLPPVDDEHLLPPFARARATPDSYRPLPPDPPGDKEETLYPVAVPPVTSVTPLSPVAEDEAPLTGDSNVEPSRSDTKSTRQSGVVVRSRATSRTSIGDFQSAGLPSHMLSQSSRFSFQLGNVDSAAQEQLLEERHKQKMAAKAVADAAKGAEEDVNNELEDDFDYDDMDAYDGFEDDVPTIGDEWDFGQGTGVSNMTLGTGALNLQEAARMALQSHPVGQRVSLPTFNDIQGLGITSSIPAQPRTIEEPVKQPEASARSKANFDDIDGFYFDDGEFDEADFDAANPFDESVLDDPSHPLYERKQPMPPLPEDPDGVLKDNDEPGRKSMVPQNSRKVRRSRLPGDDTKEPLPVHPDPNASMDTVSAYHQALALAATQAAAEGRFNRSDSITSSSLENSAELPPVDRLSAHMEDDESGVPNISSRPSLVPDEGRLSQATSGFSPTHPPAGDDLAGLAPSNKGVVFSLPGAYGEDAWQSDFDMSDYDSTLEDDPIIAAANAEALANDDEGIYGQEFGFYAKPGSFATTKDDGEAVFYQGGYFGPKDWSEIKRKKSTREPNLTPITERSEYSTRNSLISLHVPDRGDRRGAPSPGLAALASMSPGWDGDMSMETLMKLRNRAFGGSQGSLVNSSAPGSSPMNSSPVVSKDPRALWSSPIGREMNVSDYDLGADYAELLDEANLADDDEADEDHNSLGDDSPDRHASDEGSVYSDSNDDDNDPDPERTQQCIASGSPTLRASQLPSIPSSPSPPKKATPSRPRLQLHPTSSPPTTASTNLSSRTALTTPIVPPSPTPTTPASNSKANSTAPFTPISPTTNNALSSGFGSPISPIAPQTAFKKRPGHSRTGSDSVAYVRERDEEGEVRWVLERMRTAEDGGVEIVGREVVEGGRI
jgi:hypothetical protein